MNRPIRLIVVDDEPDFRDTMQRLLARAGMTVRTAGDGEQALAALDEAAADVVLCDIAMPGINGLELLPRLLELADPPAVIMLTAHGTIESAVAAMKQGAHDYLRKPVDADDVERAVERAAARVRLERENRRLRCRLARHDPYRELVGEHPAMRELRALIDKVAPTDTTVLIVGETGVGKELVARGVHQASPRAEGPFLTLNCGALTGTLLENELFGHEAGAYTGAGTAAPGLFEAAGGGTLFIDEVGEMALDLQKAFLRVLESGEFRRVGSTRPRRSDARVVAATHRDLAAAVQAGAFRRDLYFRLNVFGIHVPPLRQRLSDLPLLADHLLRLLEPQREPPRGLAPGALAALQQHDWPGNVRELKNALERALIMSSANLIVAADLPALGATGHATRPGAAPVGAAPLPDKDLSLEALERQRIEEALQRAGGNKTQAARLLGISVRSLYTRLARHGLET